MNHTELPIGLKIKKLRELRNLTQLHVAEELGLSQSAYSKIELGETEITFSRLHKISSILKITLEELISFNDASIFSLDSVMQEKDDVHIQPISQQERTLHNEIGILKEEIAFLKRIIDQMLEK